MANITKSNQAKINKTQDLTLETMYQLLDTNQFGIGDRIQHMLDRMERQRTEILNAIRRHIDPDDNHRGCFHSHKLNDFGVIDIIKVMEQAAIQYLNTLTKRQLEAYHQYVCTVDKGIEYFANGATSENIKPTMFK